MNWRFRGLRGRLTAKLILSLVGSCSLIFVLFGFQITQVYRRHVEEISFAAADRISDTIKSSILYSMQRNHRDHIYHTIKTIGGEPGINKIRIFNRLGWIRFSSDETEIGTLVDKSAEACYACHAREEPLHRLDRPDRRRLYRDAEGELILGVINAIENEPRCYSAGCHVHSPGESVLGVLDVTLSLDHAEETTAEGRSLVLFYLAVANLLIALVLGGLVWYLVHKPVRQLLAGTDRVASGDLDEPIKIRSNDEMGILSRSFNRMMEQLKQAQKELMNWGQTLEERVRQKTAELRAAHERMIAVERMASMGKLAAIVAHEINNPLLGILTSARLVQKRLLKKQDKAGIDEDTLNQVQLIADESSRCGSIVRNLLQFARDEKEDRQREDVNDLVQDALRLVRHKINLQNIETQLELDDELPPIPVDSQGIRQVLVAVLINACEALGPDGGIIELGTRLRSQEESAEIWVRDNGCGMSEETQQRIFEPFFTTKEEVKGVGLGLAVVLGIVSRHGGDVRVESEIGRGTKISILLPLQGEAEEPKESAEHVYDT